MYKKILLSFLSLVLVLSVASCSSTEMVTLKPRTIPTEHSLKYMNYLVRYRGNMVYDIVFEVWEDNQYSYDLLNSPGHYGIDIDKIYVDVEDAGFDQSEVQLIIHKFNDYAGGSGLFKDVGEYPWLMGPLRRKASFKHDEKIYVWVCFTSESKYANPGETIQDTLENSEYEQAVVLVMRPVE
jgi:hypothetical protein